MHLITSQNSDASTPASEPVLKHLVLGSMPIPSDPATVLAAGPWCFAGREDFFPDWEDHYALAPEPLTDRTLQKKAIGQALSLASDMIPRLARQLQPDHDLPEDYWELLLSPYCINVARILVEIWYRVQALVDTHGKEALQVELLPEECTFHMGTDADVILHGCLNPACIHWIFSCLLRPLCPQAWTVTEGACVSEEYPQHRPEGTGARLKDALRRMLLRLPFPPLKGMGLVRALRYSLALRHVSRSEDHSRPLREFYASSVTGAILNLPVDPLLLFMNLLPQSLRDLRHPEGRVTPMKEPRVRAASILLYEDASYRQSLALWRARGGRLVCVQHGGNYGMMQHISAMELVEYTQHAFITWGWTEQESALGPVCGKANFVPLPAPQLCRLHNCWRGGNRTLIFVGTEMPTIGYQLDSHPTPLQNVQYRDDKQWFVEALGKRRQECTLYRPYFPVPGTLDDAPWVLTRFSRVHLCSGPLTPQILNCHLLVLDHHGTTLLEAMAANVPLVCYWDPSCWPVNAAFQRLLLQLAQVGIWHSSAEAAAMQVDAIWDNPAAWWQSDPVQKARQAFLDAFAHSSRRHCDALWTGMLRRL